ncbi:MULTISPECIES: winged helix-turn-helix transcriptional regulator [unclassified Archaeoglobus]|jgi:DNA-binding HxlR family transcriptional regulator|uniref:winged helix-turn-helix transcriptional regulator n=1 Tax=unclassified Archaeoglobus TaxID=2643606 RepID=UPI0025B9DF79|nr:MULTISPECIES: winged helix-turn-helix transcriptional regulator [unclassified Archaeoglobus]
MNPTKPSFKELLKTLGLKASYEILNLLKNEPKRWSELEKEIGDKQALSYRIRELLNLGILEITIIYDTPTGSKAYQLSPLGKKILKHLEEMQEEFEKYHYAPESDEEFLNWKDDY